MRASKINKPDDELVKNNKIWFLFHIIPILIQQLLNPLIYNNEVMIPLSDFIEKKEETTKKMFLIDNIEYLMLTFDLLYFKGLVI